jgi:hypothetical protein
VTAGVDKPVTKRNAPLSSFLSESMKISRMVEVLEGLPFDSREQGRIVVDRVTRNYLASRNLAAADPEQTIHQALARRGPDARSFPKPTMFNVRKWPRKMSQASGGAVTERGYRAVPREDHDGGKRRSARHSVTLLWPIAR